MLKPHPTSVHSLPPTGTATDWRRCRKPIPLPPCARLHLRPLSRAPMTPTSSQSPARPAAATKRCLCGCASAPKLALLPPTRTRRSPVPPCSSSSGERAEASAGCKPAAPRPLQHCTEAALPAVRHAGPSPRTLQAAARAQRPPGPRTGSTCCSARMQGRSPRQARKHRLRSTTASRNGQPSPMCSCCSWACRTAQTCTWPWVHRPARTSFPPSSMTPSVHTLPVAVTTAAAAPAAPASSVGATTQWAGTCLNRHLLPVHLRITLPPLLAPMRRHRPRQQMQAATAAAAARPAAATTRGLGQSRPRLQ